MRFLCFALLICASTFFSAANVHARNIALIIANANYAEMGTLRNPVNDMNRMTAALQAIGYDVRRATDLRRDQMAGALLDFARESRGADTAMIFYSGHGFEADGINYLIPVDFAPRHPADVKFAAIKLDDAMEAVAGATRLSIVVLDACRNNPLSGTRGGGRGMARVTARPSQVVAYSTAPGQVAQDGVGSTSPYTQALAEMMQANPAMDVRRLFTSLSARTTELAQTEQIPYAEFGAFNANHVSLNGDVPDGQQPVAIASPSPAEMLALWDAIKDSNDPVALQNFANNYPTSPLAIEANRRRTAMLDAGAGGQSRIAVAPSANSDNWTAPQSATPQPAPIHRFPAKRPADKKSLLPHVSEIPPTKPLPIDGIWTAAFNGAQYRLSAGRSVAVTPYQHLIVFPVERDDVVVQGITYKGPGKYEGYDLVGQAPWHGELQRDGTISVRVGLFSTVLTPVRPDNPQWLSQEVSQAHGG